MSTGNMLFIVRIPQIQHLKFVASPKLMDDAENPVVVEDPHPVPKPEEDDLAIEKDFVPRKDILHDPSQFLNDLNHLTIREAPDIQSYMAQETLYALLKNKLKFQEDQMKQVILMDYQYSIRPGSKPDEEPEIATGPVLDVVKLVEMAIQPMLDSHDTITMTLSHSDPNEEKQATLMFPVRHRCAEKVLYELRRIGVGDSFGSVDLIPISVSVLPEEKQPITSGKKKPKIVEGMKSRMILYQVIEQTKAGTAFTFDYLMLLIVASIIAGLGLAANNVAVIVAAMLVSPLMGPVLAVCFSALIFDWKLLRYSSKVEIGSLLICVLVGVLVGAIFTPFADHFDWPSSEMTSRGDYVGLILGIGIAFFSGVGVALSVLGNNTNSLVGVAISASLLPPAVNCGMLMIYAIFVRSWDYFGQGIISLLLTIVNILFIFLAAILMFKIKEVAPIPNKTDFWKYYVSDVRRKNKSDEVVENVDLPITSSDEYQMSVPFHHTVTEYLAAQDLTISNWGKHGRKTVRKDRPAEGSKGKSSFLGIDMSEEENSNRESAPPKSLYEIFPENSAHLDAIAKSAQSS